MAPRLPRCRPARFTPPCSGTVDAIGFPYTYAFAAFKLDEVADWVTTNMKLGTVTCPTAFSKKAYDTLPDQYKQLLGDVKPGAYKAMADAYVAMDKINETKWAEGGKIKMVKMVKIPENEMAEFRRIAGAPAWNAWVEENKDKLPAQELLDLVLETAKKAM